MPFKFTGNSIGSKSSEKGAASFRTLDKDGKLAGRKPNEYTIRKKDEGIKKTNQSDLSSLSEKNFFPGNDIQTKNDRNGYVNLKSADKSVTTGKDNIGLENKPGLLEKKNRRANINESWSKGEDVQDGRIQSAYEKLTGKKIGENHKQDHSFRRRSEDEDLKQKSKQNEKSFGTSGQLSNDHVAFKTRSLAFQTNISGSSLEVLRGTRNYSGESTAATLNASDINSLQNGLGNVTESVNRLVTRISSGVKAVASKASRLGGIAMATILGISAVGGGITSTTAFLEGGQTYDTTNTFISIENCPNAYQAYKILISEGLSDVVACAILGNAFSETGGVGSHDITPNARSSKDFGIWQWTSNGESSGVSTGINWLTNHGYAWNSLEGQCKLLISEIKGQGGANGWNYGNTAKALVSEGLLSESYADRDYFLSETSNLYMSTAAFLGFYEGPADFPVTRLKVLDNGLKLTQVEYAKWEYDNRTNLASACYNAFVGGAIRWKNLDTAYANTAYVDWAISIAADDTHGYSQEARDGNPDYDCSSFVAYALKNAGYNVSVFSTIDEPDVLVAAGFTKLSYQGTDLKKGDILWRRNNESGHTEIYIGNGRTVGAHKDYDGLAGDSTGEEICKKDLTDDWMFVFRPPNVKGGTDMWYSDWGTTYSGGMGIPHYDMTKYNIAITNGNVSADGCGIVVLAMVESYCRGSKVSVEDIASFSTPYVVGGRGVIDANSYFTTVPGQNGYQNGEINSDGITGIRRAIQNNQPVILLTSNSQFTKRMHFVVIRGMIEQNGQYYYYVNDPSDGYVGKTFKENTAVPESYITNGYAGSWIF